MQQLAEDLWVCDAPLRFMGLELGARMTAVRLPSGALWLHSPIAAEPHLVREVEALGPVTCLVAPNCFHHLYVAEWQRAFPEAATFIAPGLEARRPHFKGSAVLSEDPGPAWEGAIEQICLQGLPASNEVVFFHCPSATLIVTDLALNVGPQSAPLTRVVFRLLGAYGRLAPTLLERLLVRDRGAFRHSLEQILQWPFERVVVAHGGVVEQGRDALVRGYAWVLDG